MTTIASFGALAFSPHRGIASLGMVLVMGLGFTLLCTLVVLPALIEWKQAASEARSPGSGRVGARFRTTR